MHWRFADCESDAREMRGLGALPPDELFPAREIGRAAGLKFTILATKGCAAEICVRDWRVHLHAHGHPWTKNFSNAHELAHFIRTLLDGSWPHDEQRADWTAAALLLPRAPVREALRRFGLHDPRGLTAAFPEVPPAWAYLRAAWVAGRAAVVHQGGRRLVWAPEGFPVPARGELGELRLARKVKASMRVERELFAEAFPLGRVGAAGVVILLPEVSVASGW